MLQQETKQQERMEDVAEGTQKTGMSPLSWAAVGSIALSWYYYFGKGNKEMGLFVGLWPPTFLALGSYFKINEIHDDVKALSNPGSTLRDTVQEMMQNRNR
ncbi:hypothetical protein [Halostella pelagica]|uniref:hypothetical protein n=2 Tax=Halostella TaxID=1843185 RepID=UPI001080DC64|nr:hypothetical protein [Halostella pelagica]